MRNSFALVILAALLSLSGCESERKRRTREMNAKMIIGICLVVFIIGGLVFLRLKNRKK